MGKNFIIIMKAYDYYSGVVSSVFSANILVINIKLKDSTSHVGS